MERIFGLCKTVSRARSLIVEGTLFSNVQDIIQQVNECINALNGSTIFTGGQYNQPIKQWTFNLQSLGIGMMYVDNNYIAEMTPSLNFMADFARDALETEMLMDSARGGLLVQSLAIRTLNENKYKALAYDAEDPDLKNYNAGTRLADSIYQSSDPIIFPEKDILRVLRTNNARTASQGVRTVTFGNEIQTCIYDSWFAANNNNDWRNTYTHAMPVPVSDAVISVDRSVPQLSCPALLGDQIKWLYDPIMMIEDEIEVAFLDGGNVVYVLQNFGIANVPRFDSIEFRLRMRRPLPANLSATINNMFPAGGAADKMMAIGCRLKVISCSTADPILSEDTPYVNRIFTTRIRYGAGPGQVFPAPFNWMNIVEHYTPPRMVNMIRMITAAKADSLLDL